MRDSGAFYIIGLISGVIISLIFETTIYSAQSKDGIGYVAHNGKLIPGELNTDQVNCGLEVFPSGGEF